MLILAGTCSAPGSVFISEAPCVCLSETKMFQDLGFVESFQKPGIIAVQRIKMSRKTKSEFSGGSINSLSALQRISDASVFLKTALKLFPVPSLK